MEPWNINLLIKSLPFVITFVCLIAKLQKCVGGPILNTKPIKAWNYEADNNTLFTVVLYIMTQSQYTALECVIFWRKQKKTAGALTCNTEPVYTQQV